MSDNHFMFGKIPRIISVGFAGVWLLLVILLLVMLFRMQAMYAGTAAIVKEHQVKIELVYAMMDAIRQRQIGLRNLYFIEDVFEREESRIRFYDSALLFVEPRRKLLAMPLDAEELTIIDEMSGYVKSAYGKQNYLIDLLMEAAHPAELGNYLMGAFDGQSLVIASLKKLLEYQRQKMKIAVAQSSALYITSIYMAIGFGGVALLLSFGIAWQVVRRTSAQTRLIENLAKISTEYPSPVIRIGTDRTVLYANHASACILNLWGVKPLEKMDAKIFNFIHEVGGGGKRELEVECNNRIYSFVVTRANHTEYFNLYGRDITDQETMKREIAHQATHDALTGLANRREFELRLSQAIESAKSSGDRHAILYLDLDQFKIVNDSGGHIAGDTLLMQLAEQFGKVVRQSDCVARLGGDEFGVILHRCQINNAIEISEKLRNLVCNHRFFWDGKPYEVGVSIGVAEINGASETRSLLSAVDSACYIAKENGRNQVHVYDASDEAVERFHGEIKWAQQIKEALQENMFQLYTQKICATKENMPDYHEVLLRMLDKNGDVIAPSKFIPAAERYDLMPVIDKWVIETLITSDAAAKSGKYFSINLSGQSLCDKSFIAFLTSALADCAVDTKKICFEITETAAIRHLGQAVEAINTLRKYGCIFCLDDFGSGLCSFSYLRDLQVEMLKIDGGFVRDILSDRISSYIVESILTVAKNMNLRVVGEYVETDAIAIRLKEMGIDYLQGYALDKPKLYLQGRAKKWPKLESTDVVECV